MDFVKARDNMIDCQLRTNKVTDLRLLDAFSAVPREVFLPESRRGIAYIDEDVAIGDGRYLMEPMVLARMLQAAAIGEGDMVLDVGAGTGYATALMAKLAATVVALESEGALVKQADDTLTELGVDNAVVVEGKLEEGYPKQGPYNVILLNGAVSKLPEAILDQLAEDGRLIAVVAEGDRGTVLGRATLARRSGGTVSSRPLFDATTPYLEGFEPKAAFSF